MQVDLATLRKLDERKWKEKRKRSYLYSQNLKENIRGEEVNTAICEIFTDNCYESGIEDIYNTRNYKKYEE